MPRHLAAVAAAVSMTAASVCLAVSLPSQQITPSNDALSERWLSRNSTTSLGRIVFVASNETVYFFNGSSVQSVQATTGDAVNEAVMMLGSGATAGSVIGGWRRGAGLGYVSVDGGSAHTVDLNPEHLAIRDGCVFMVLQTPTAGNHVFQIDPATGAKTQISSGTANANFGASRVSTSGCKAVYSWQPTTASNTDLYYWNGTTATPIATAVADPTTSFAAGRIVYVKEAGGIQQVFAIDTAVSLSPVQLSSEIDAARFIRRPQTDGRHVAWYSSASDGSNAGIVLNGGIVFPTGPLGKLDNNEFPFQLNRSQLLWTNAAPGTPRTIFYDDGAQAFTLNPSPATEILFPWLTDGYVAFLGPTPTGGTDRDVFRVTGTAPADSIQPSPPMMVIATPGTVQVRWDAVLGATSYNAYVAYAPGVTKDNYASLAGGRRITGVTSGFTIPGIPTNTTYYVTITALEGATESPSSRVASTIFVGNLVWQPVGGLAATTFYSVAADPSNASLVYAGANGSVYKSSDGGIQWTQVLASGTTGGTRAAALSVSGARVFASVMPQGDIWRSPDFGGTWTPVLDGASMSQAGALAIAPSNADVAYAGDFTASDPSTQSSIVKTVTGGSVWTHTAVGPSFPDEISGIALAIDPSNPSAIYAGGNGTPNVASSASGGTSWTNAQIPSGGQVNSLSIDPQATSTLYASTRDKGVFKSLDGGGIWTAKNAGLAGVSTTFGGGAEFNSILADPASPNLLHLGAGNGYWISLDGGESWNAANDGFGGSPAFVNALAITAGRRLIAATLTGLYMMSFAPAPVITGALPASGNVTGGSAVTISGGGFQSGAGVTFGGAGATGVTVVSEGTITCTSPAHAAGSVSIVVTNPDLQSATLPGGFTYTNAPAIPTGLTATAQSTTSVLVAWSAAAGATSYQVFRRSAGGGFNPIATPTATSYDDSVSPGTSHVYRVRAANGSGASNDSNADIATTVMFSNDPLTGGTVVQAAHPAELRTAVNAVRTLAGSGDFLFTDSLTAGLVIKAIHVTELRSALDTALATLSLPTGGYTDSVLSTVPIKAVHFQEIRDRIR